MTVATVGANGRWRWNLSGLGQTIVDGRVVNLAFMGDIREWMTLTEGERWQALGEMASTRRRVAMADGPAPLRIPRTALGLCHAGPIAPSLVDVGWILYLPGGRTERMSRAPGSDR